MGAPPRRRILPARRTAPRRVRGDKTERCRNRRRQSRRERVHRRQSWFARGEYQIGVLPLRVDGGPLVVSSPAPQLFNSGFIKPFPAIERGKARLLDFGRAF